MTTSPDRSGVATYGGHPMLRPTVVGAAIFDGVMGVGCLALADRLGGWLSLGAGTVRVTGAVFLIASLTGGLTAWRRTADVRAIAAANLVFAAWCLAVVGYDSPKVWAGALLVVSAATAAGTAALEHRLSRSA